MCNEKDKDIDSFVNSCGIIVVFLLGLLIFEQLVWSKSEGLIEYKFPNGETYTLHKKINKKTSE